MQDLVIICAGEFGEDMVDNIRWINGEEPRWNLLGFIDDGKTGEVAGVPILGTVEDYLKMDKHIQFFVATLDGKVREKIITRCKAAGFTGAVILGEKVLRSGTQTLGQSIYIGHRSLLLDGVAIGDGVILEHGNSLCENVAVGPYSTLRIFSNLAVSVKIGAHSFFDLRCVVDDGVATAEGCTFGSGAVVLTDATEAGRYEGIPAKRAEQ